MMIDWSYNGGYLAGGYIGMVRGSGIGPTIATGDIFYMLVGVMRNNPNSVTVVQSVRKRVVLL